MKNLILKFIWLFLLMLPLNALAQVTISPTAVFLDRNSKVGTFYISNPSATAVEVQISFEFAYPTTDENGRVYLEYDDEESRELFSLEPYLRAFPTTFALDPNTRQTVRLIGRLPQDSAPGLYWTRMRVSSSQLTPPIAEVSEGQVAAQVSFQIDQVTAVVVHHGSVTTGLEIHQTTTDFENDNIVILTDVERTGNSAYIGSVRTGIYNSNNQLVDERRSSISVYFRNLQRVEFDTSSWQPDTYSVVTTFETSRNDVSTQNLIQLPDITARTTFTLE